MTQNQPYRFFEDTKRQSFLSNKSHIFQVIASLSSSLFDRHHRASACTLWSYNLENKTKRYSRYWLVWALPITALVNVKTSSALTLFLYSSRQLLIQSQSAVSWGWKSLVERLCNICLTLQFTVSRITWLFSPGSERVIVNHTWNCIRPESTLTSDTHFLMFLDILFELI